MTNAKKIATTEKLSQLGQLLAQRDKLKAQIVEIENKGEKASEMEVFAVESMRTKLVSVEGQIGPQSEASIIAGLFDAAKALQASGFVTGSVQYIVTLNADGDPLVEAPKSKRKAGSGSATRGKYVWNVDGKTGSEATKIVVDLGIALVLVTGEYKPLAVRGIAARKGWKIHKSVGSLVQHLKGPKVGTNEGKDVFGSYEVPSLKGKTHTVTITDDKMYAFKRGLIALSKDSKIDAVKHARNTVAELLHDAMVEDGVLVDGKKADLNTLLSYINEQQKIADQSDAEQV